jgi:hypothetical protein
MAAPMIIPATGNITIVNPHTGRAVVKVEWTAEGFIVRPAPHATIILEDGIVIEPHRKPATEVPYATDIERFPT